MEGVSPEGVRFIYLFTIEFFLHLIPFTVTTPAVYLPLESTLNI